jgi:DNA-binding PadR family transcriptional regulator
VKEFFMHDRFSHDVRHGPRGRHGRHRHGYGRHFGRGGARARRGDVRAAILALLAERTMHGYEMIQELDERTGGVWRPSAGSIYPTLQLLEDEGLIRGEESDGKRRFELTDEGREQAEERSGPLAWEAVTAGVDPEQIRLHKSFFALRAAVRQVVAAGNEAQASQVRELLDETRRKVYGILAEAD